MAIDWSMRVNTRSRNSRSSVTSARTARPRRRCAPSTRPSRPGTCRSPFRPRASPRRCRRARRWRRRKPRRGSAPAMAIIDSIICVAVMVSLLRLARHADHRLLQRRHRGVADFDGEVAARDHDAVGGVRMSSSVRSTASARSILAISRALAAGGAQQLARHVHVGARSWERRRRRSRRSICAAVGCRPCPWRSAPARSGRRPGG